MSDQPAFQVSLVETGGREEDFLPQKAPSLGNAFPSDSKRVEVANHVDIVGEKQIAHSTIFFFLNQSMIELCLRHRD